MIGPVTVAVSVAVGKIIAVARWTDDEWARLAFTLSTRDANGQSTDLFLTIVPKHVGGGTRRSTLTTPLGQHHHGISSRPFRSPSFDPSRASASAVGMLLPKGIHTQQDTSAPRCIPRAPRVPAATACPWCTGHAVGGGQAGGLRVCACVCTRTCARVHSCAHGACIHHCNMLPMGRANTRRCACLY